MITANGHTISIKSFKATPCEADVVRHALASFGFLVRGQLVSLQASCSIGQFADLIERSYDKTSPKIGEVTRVLRSVHARQKSADQVIVRT